jgi:hypothetical protein
VTNKKGINKKWQKRVLKAGNNNVRLIRSECNANDY